MAQINSPQNDMLQLAPSMHEVDQGQVPHRSALLM